MTNASLSKFAIIATVSSLMWGASVLFAQKAQATGFHLPAGEWTFKVELTDLTKEGYHWVHTVVEELQCSFLVLPESPIGAVAAFAGYRRYMVKA